MINKKQHPQILDLPSISLLLKAQKQQKDYCFLSDRYYIVVY